MALLVVGMFGLFFLGALYLQRILGYSPLQVGLAFLPSTLVMGITSLRLSARFAPRTILVPSLVLIAGGMLLFARAPVDGSYVVDVLPGTILIGLGAGIAFNPMLLAAMSDVKPEDSGLASGVVNTAFMMGGALGLAVLASIASSRTSGLRSSGDTELAALTGGYHVAFLVGAIFAFAAAATGTALLRVAKPAHAPADEPMLEAA
jgi:hypothetical protein